MDLTPGDQSLINDIVTQLKSQGIFDQFRKECIADVDTKPAYENLRHRVDGYINSYLSSVKWSPNLSKNQMREYIRKYLTESSFLDQGVQRVVEQIVNPKIHPTLVPKVEDVVYKIIKSDGTTEDTSSHFDYEQTSNHDDVEFSDNIVQPYGNNQFDNDVEMKTSANKIDPENVLSGNVVDVDEMDDEISPPFEPHVPSNNNSSDSDFSHSSSKRRKLLETDNKQSENRNEHFITSVNSSNDDKSVESKTDEASKRTKEKYRHRHHRKEDGKNSKHRRSKKNKKYYNSDEEEKIRVKDEKSEKRKRRKSIDENDKHKKSCELDKIVEHSFKDEDSSKYSSSTDIEPKNSKPISSSGSNRRHRDVNRNKKEKGKKQLKSNDYYCENDKISRKWSSDDDDFSDGPRSSSSSRTSEQKKNTRHSSNNGNNNNSNSDNHNTKYEEKSRKNCEFRYSTSDTDNDDDDDDDNSGVEIENICSMTDIINSSPKTDYNLLIDNKNDVIIVFPEKNDEYIKKNGIVDEKKTVTSGTNILSCRKITVNQPRDVDVGYERADSSNKNEKFNLRRGSRDNSDDIVCNNSDLKQFGIILDRVRYSESDVISYVRDDTMHFNKVNNNNNEPYKRNLENINQLLDERLEKDVNNNNNIPGVFLDNSNAVIDDKTIIPDDVDNSSTDVIEKQITTSAYFENPVRDMAIIKYNPSDTEEKQIIKSNKIVNGSGGSSETKIRPLLKELKIIIPRISDDSKILSDRIDDNRLDGHEVLLADETIKPDVSLIVNDGNSRTENDNFVVNYVNTENDYGKSIKNDDDKSIKNDDDKSIKNDDDKSNKNDDDKSIKNDDNTEFGDKSVKKIHHYERTIENQDESFNAKDVAVDTPLVIDEVEEIEKDNSSIISESYDKSININDNNNGIFTSEENRINNSFNDNLISTSRDDDDDNNNNRSDDHLEKTNNNNNNVIDKLIDVCSDRSISDLLSENATFIFNTDEITIEKCDKNYVETRLNDITSSNAIIIDPDTDGRNLIDEESNKRDIFINENIGSINNEMFRKKLQNHIDGSNAARCELIFCTNDDDSDDVVESLIESFSTRDKNKTNKRITFDNVDDGKRSNSSNENKTEYDENDESVNSIETNETRISSKINDDTLTDLNVRTDDEDDDDGQRKNSIVGNEKNCKTELYAEKENINPIEIKNDYSVHSTFDMEPGDGTVTDLNVHADIEADIKRKKVIIGNEKTHDYKTESLYVENKNKIPIDTNRIRSSSEIEVPDVTMNDVNVRTDVEDDVKRKKFINEKTRDYKTESLQAGNENINSIESNRIRSSSEIEVRDDTMNDLNVRTDVEDDVQQQKVMIENEMTRDYKTESLHIRNENIDSIESNRIRSTSEIEARDSANTDVNVSTVIEDDIKRKNMIVRNVKTRDYKMESLYVENKHKIPIETNGIRSSSEIEARDDIMNDLNVRTNVEDDVQQQKVMIENEMTRDYKTKSLHIRNENIDSIESNRIRSTSEIEVRDSADTDLNIRTDIEDDVQQQKMIIENENTRDYRTETLHTANVYINPIESNKNDFIRSTFQTEVRGCTVIGLNDVSVTNDVTEGKDVDIFTYRSETGNFSGSFIKESSYCFKITEESTIVPDPISRVSNSIKEIRSPDECSCILENDKLQETTIGTEFGEVVFKGFEQYPMQNSKLYHPIYAKANRSVCNEICFVKDVENGYNNDASFPDEKNIELFYGFEDVQQLTLYNNNYISELLKIIESRSNDVRRPEKFKTSINNNDDQLFCGFEDSQQLIKRNQHFLSEVSKIIQSESKSRHNRSTDNEDCKLFFGFENTQPLMQRNVNVINQLSNIIQSESSSRIDRLEDNEDDVFSGFNIDPVVLQQLDTNSTNIRTKLCEYKYSEQIDKNQEYTGLVGDANIEGKSRCVGFDNRQNNLYKSKFVYYAYIQANVAINEETRDKAPEKQSSLLETGCDLNHPDVCSLTNKDSTDFFGFEDMQEISVESNFCSSNDRQDDVKFIYCANYNRIPYENGKIKKKRRFLNKHYRTYSDSNKLEQPLTTELELIRAIINRKRKYHLFLLDDDDLCLPYRMILKRRYIGE